jgi:hypothetical protein
MHPDDADTDRLDDQADDELGTTDRSFWWALHRPETYALAAMVLAVAGLFGPLLPGFELVQAYDPGGSNEFRLSLGVTAGVRLGVAALAAGLAVASLRNEDSDVTWSAPVARAALIVAALAALFALAILLGVLAVDGKPDYEFA